MWLKKFDDNREDLEFKLAKLEISFQQAMEEYGKTVVALAAVDGDKLSEVAGQIRELEDREKAIRDTLIDHIQMMGKEL